MCEAVARVVSCVCVCVLESTEWRLHRLQANRQSRWVTLCVRVNTQTNIYVPFINEARGQKEVYVMGASEWTVAIFFFCGCASPMGSSHLCESQACACQVKSGLIR